MSAQAQKMRNRLAVYAKEREAFEQKKKELDEEMVRSRLNMGKIQKGLRNNEIVEEPIDVSLLSPSETSPSKKASQNKYITPTGSQKLGGKARPTPRPTTTTSRTNRNGTDDLKSPRSAADSTCPQQAVIIPTGPRVSDWCYLGPLDSDPPAVKANDIYEVVRLLGRGAFGDVNLVKCVEDNRLYAMKTIFTEREKDMKETLHEVRFLRMNRHPCIIDIHDGFMTAQPRMLFIVMPYCEGGDLDTVIKTTKKNRMTIAEDRIVRWSSQIALAMHFLHENGTIHRDLKPRNIMVTEGGDLVKVADFGLAFSFKEEQVASSMEAGTPYYTAPEMIQNLPYAYAADCWSFGVLFHEMLRLELPFLGSSTADLVRSILSEEPPPLPSHYSNSIKNVASALLNKDPEKRLGMAGLLLDPFFQSKTAAFPQSYRPKAVEERIRRAQARQLTQQIENLTASRNSSLTSVTDLIALHHPKILLDAPAAAEPAAAGGGSDGAPLLPPEVANQEPAADTDQTGQDNAQTDAAATVSTSAGVPEVQDDKKVADSAAAATKDGDGDGGVGHVILGGRIGQAIAEALNAAEEIAAEMDEKEEETTDEQEQLLGPLPAAEEEGDTNEEEEEEEEEEEA